MKPAGAVKLLSFALMILLICANSFALPFLSGCSGHESSEGTEPSSSAAAVFVSASPVVTQEASSAPSAPPTAEPTVPPTEAPEPTTDELIDAYIASMSLEDKLGQLVMFGFSGKNSVSAEFTEIINEYRVGNVIFYGNNVDRSDGSGGFDTMAKLVEKLSEISPNGIPRLYSIDIEGGQVHRFTWERELKSAYHLGGKSGDEASEQFLYIGERLKSLGINVDLAPVLDVSPEPLSTFLGDRIISADADITAEIGAAMIAGLHEGGCLATAKHFPGHGGTNEDSHKLTPVVYSSRERLYGYDLAPFAAAVDAGVDCVLVAHILYPELDPDDIASMSPVIINGILRDELGFGGVVISDDFRMQGLTGRYPAREAAVKFILAGGDIILCGAEHDLQRAIFEGLYAAAEDGTLSGERIDLSVHRVLAAKLAAGIWSPAD